jgi:hypothetical protein
MIYLNGLGSLKRPKLERFHKFPNDQMLIGCEFSLACVIIIKGLLKDLVALLNI